LPQKDAKYKRQGNDCSCLRAVPGKTGAGAEKKTVKGGMAE